MKKLLFALLVSIPSLLIAQDSAIAFKEAVSVQALTKEELFQRAKDAFSESFKSSKLTLQTDNMETGEINGNGEMALPLTLSDKQLNSKVTYDIYIKVIKGRYLVRFSNFNHQYINQEFSGFGLITTATNSPVKQPGLSIEGTNQLWQQVKQEVSLRIEPLMDKLQVAMKKKITEKPTATIQ